MLDFVTYELKDRVAVITLNRPAERNAFGTHEDCKSIIAAFERANAASEVRCIVLTGAGSAFCAGGNIRKMLDNDGITKRETPLLTRESYRRGIQRVALALWNCEIPTLAAVNGPAIGVGCDIACFCDIRIASKAARFAESFINLGLVPGDGGAWILPRIIGLSRAAQMTFSGEDLDADTAERWGLVSQVVEPDRLLPEALAIANGIASRPAGALRLSKRLLRESLHTRLSDLLELSAGFQALAHETPEHRAAVDAFLQSRAARRPS